MKDPCYCTWKWRQKVPKAPPAISHQVGSLTFSPMSGLLFIAPDLQGQTCTELLGKEPASGLCPHLGPGAAVIMEALGSCVLHPVSASHRKPCPGLSLPPWDGHSRRRSHLVRAAQAHLCCCVPAFPETTRLPPRLAAGSRPLRRSVAVVRTPALLTASFAVPFPLPRSLSLCLCFFIFQKISSRKGKGAKTKAQEIPV